MRNILLLGVSLIAFAPHHAQAQWLFKKAAPKVPAQRVPELIQILRGDPDERKRSSAAEELREYDAKAYPQIIPGLVEAALRDSKHGVRSDALNSLSRIRPVSPMAGQALEYAAANDAHWSNRIQAKSQLLRYQWAGYTPGSGDKNPPVAPDTKEPVTAARPQPNNLPPIVSVPVPTPGSPVANGQNPSLPAPQFPSAGNVPAYPYQAQNPLTSAPAAKMPATNPSMKNPLAVSPVNRTPYQTPPPVTSVPTPGTFEPIPMPPVAVVPKTGTFEPIVIPVPQPAAPVAAVPLPMPEPALQFRPVINEPNAPITVTPGVIPLIDLNPVLTNPGATNAPAVVTPPLIVPTPDAGRTPLPPLPNDVPGLPLPKI